MIVRTARQEERSALEDLQRRSSLALDAYRSELEAHPEAIHLPQEQIDRGDVLVVDVDGRPAGFAAVEGGELDGLFVDPGLWRGGIGRKLVDAAVHLARSRGLTLTVAANPEAKEFYEKCGFRGEEEIATRFGPAIRMSR